MREVLLAGGLLDGPGRVGGLCRGGLQDEGDRHALRQVLPLSHEPLVLGKFTII